MADGKYNRGYGPVGIDHELRDRTVENIETFSEALDKALASPTSDAIDELRVTADDLMRAVARVLLELERARGEPI